jgi:hypothetical protein
LAALPTTIENLQKTYSGLCLLATSSNWEKTKAPQTVQPFWLLALLIVPDPRALPLLLLMILSPIAEKSFCKQAFASKLSQAICSGKL